MTTNDLLMRIYKMQEQEACFHLRAGRKASKVTGLVGVMPFVAEMKQLAKSINAGASPQCAIPLRKARGLDYELNVCVNGADLVLELALKGECCFRHEFSSRNFIASVDGMIASLPAFL